MKATKNSLQRYKCTGFNEKAVDEENRSHRAVQQLCG